MPAPRMHECVCPSRCCGVYLCPKGCRSGSLLPARAGVCVRSAERCPAGVPRLPPCTAALPTCPGREEAAGHSGSLLHPLLPGAAPLKRALTGPPKQSRDELLLHSRGRFVWRHSPSACVCQPCARGWGCRPKGHMTWSGREWGELGSSGWCAGQGTGRAQSARKPGPTLEAASPHPSPAHRGSSAFVRCPWSNEGPFRSTH